MIYPMYEGKETCERCHKPIDNDKVVWFELNCRTGEWCEPGTIQNENDHQGGFAFGPDCAKAVRKDRFNWKYVGLAKRDRG